MGTPFHWIAFNFFIVIASALDLRVFHRRPHKIGIREAALASFSWIAVSVLFGFGVLYFHGDQPALELEHSEPKEDRDCDPADRKSTRLNSSHQIISYAVFCLKKKNIQPTL